MTLPPPLASAPFTTATARAHGLGAAALHDLRAAGVLRTLLHGVHVSTGVEPTLEVRARAAALVLPTHAVIADRSAAWLHGVEVFDAATLEAGPLLEVVSAAGATRTRRPGVLGGKRDLGPEDIVTIDGVRVTTPIRTACDLARLRGRPRALSTLDGFRRAFDISRPDLTAMLPRYAGRRGVIQLRELIPLSTCLADSPPESWVRLAIHDFGLPMPSAQVRVPRPDGGFFKLENAWRHLRVAVEYDGEEHHSEDADRAHDAARRDVLTRELDWRIFVLRAEALAPSRQDGWLREVERVVRERAGLRQRRVYARGPETYLWGAR